MIKREMVLQMDPSERETDLMGRGSETEREVSGDFQMDLQDEAFNRSQC